MRRALIREAFHARRSGTLPVGLPIHGQADGGAVIVPPLTLATLCRLHLIPQGIEGCRFIIVV